MGLETVTNLTGHAMMVIALTTIVVLVVQSIAGAMSELFILFVSLNKNTMDNIFPLFNNFSSFFLSLAIILLILIASWQSFKTMFSYLGFETIEEPGKLFFKILTFGILTFHAHAIILYIIGDVYTPMLKFIVDSTSIDNNIFSQLGRSIGSSVMRFDLLGFGIYTYIVLKFIGVAISFAKRTLLLMILIVTSPLAFVAGISKSTQPFLSGYVKLFASNLFTQMIQFIVATRVLLYVYTVFFASEDDSLGYFPKLVLGMVIFVSMIKLLDKVEEVLGQMSLATTAGPSSVAFIGTINQLKQIYGNTTSIFGAVTGKGSSGRPSGHDSSTIPSRDSNQDSNSNDSNNSSEE